MNKFLGLLFLVALVQSCSTDVDVAAPWKDIPVIYATLDARDTTHYIRIQKAYLDEKRSALDFAPVYDSVYYKNINPSIQVLNGFGNQIALLPLTRIMVRKDTGIFAGGTHELYTFNGKLNTGNKYKLVLTTPYGEVVNAETNITDTVRSLRPFPNTSSYNYSKGTLSMRFTQPTNGYMHDMYAILHYAEWNRNTPNDTVNKTILYPIYKGALFTGNPTTEMKLPGKDVFTALKVNIKNIEPNTFRLFRGCEFYVGVANIELGTYIQVNNVDPGFLPQKPVYSNVSNGFGIFGSRSIYPINENQILNPRYPYSSPTFVEAQRFAGMDSLIYRYPELNFVQ